MKYRLSACFSLVVAAQLHLGAASIRIASVEGDAVRRAEDAQCAVAERPRTALLHVSHVHRGGGAHERPDNTLETFKWCWENGAAVECDCRRTRDGVGIMLHDATLKRTAREISEEVANMSVSDELNWNDIKDVDVGSYLSPVFSNERIPTVEQTFAAMKGHPKWLCFVDEKGAGPKYIAQKAREAGVIDQVYYTGMHYEKALEWMQDVPDGKTMLWIGTWPEPKHTPEGAANFEKYFERRMEKVRKGGYKGLTVVSLHSYYNPNSDVPFVPREEYLRKLIDELHAHGIAVVSMPFEGGQLEETYLKLFDMGFDGFSTDYPSVMFSVLRRLRAGK